MVYPRVKLSFQNEKQLVRISKNVWYKHYTYTSVPMYFSNLNL